MSEILPTPQIKRIPTFGFDFATYLTQAVANDQVHRTSINTEDNNENIRRSHMRRIQTDIHLPSSGTQTSSRKNRAFSYGGPSADSKKPNRMQSIDEKDDDNNNITTKAYVNAGRYTNNNNNGNNETNTNETPLQVLSLNNDKENKNDNSDNDDDNNHNVKSLNNNENKTSQNTLKSSLAERLKQMEFNIESNASLYIIILYYLLRFSSIIITLVIGSVGLNYAIGQLIIIESTNVFCEKKTREEVYEHSKKINNPKGTGLLCWRILDQEFDYTNIYSSNILTAETDFSSCGGWLLFFLMLIPTSLLFYLCIYHFYYTIYDIYYHCNHKINPRLKKKQEKLKSKQNFAHFNNHQNASFICYSCCKIHPFQCDANYSYCSKQNCKLFWHNYLWKRFFKYLHNKFNHVFMYAYFYTDSKWKILNMIMSETIEVTTQTISLLIYGGYTIFSNDLVLAQEPTLVKLFAIILGLNCIITGILWIFYIVFPLYFHGTQFQSMLFIIDMAFDLTYTIFPMIVADATLFDPIGMGTLNAQNAYLVFSSFVPLCFVSKKCANILDNFDPVKIFSRQEKLSQLEMDFDPFIAIDYQSSLPSLSVANYNHNTNNNNEIKEGKNADKSISSSSSTLKEKIQNKLPFLISYNKKRKNNISIQQHQQQQEQQPEQYQQEEKEKKKQENEKNEEEGQENEEEEEKKKEMQKEAKKKASYEEWKKQQLKRKMLIGIWGIMLLIIGLLIIILPISYINSSEEFCDNVSEKLKSENIQLYYWNQINTISSQSRGCVKKVYPFFIANNNNNNIPCECRSLRIFIDETTESYYSPAHISLLLEKYTMLEKYGVDFDDTWYNTHFLDNNKTYVNLNSQNLPVNLRILDVQEINVANISSTIGNLKNLEILMVPGGNFTTLPWDAIKKLTKLKILDISRNPYFTGEGIEALCYLTELRFINLGSTSITYLPDCFKKLTKLGRIDFQGTLLTNITANIFYLPNIVNIVGYLTALNASTFPELDLSKKGKNLERMWFQGNPNKTSDLCQNFDNLPTKTQDFFNNFNSDNYTACFDPCGIFMQDCPIYYWQNGECNEQCNTKCLYDGGDCNQLCECDYHLWLNGVCDQECNTTNCAYDFGDCIDDTPIYNCSSGCREDWISDDWCDSDCLSATNCTGEEVDCTACTGSCYDLWYYAIANVASISAPYETLSLDELCNFWAQISLFSDAYDNCTQAFNAFDANDNGQVSMYETLQASASFFGISDWKAKQVNCSICLTDPSNYY